MQKQSGREWWRWLTCLSIASRCVIVEALYLGGCITDWQLWDVLSHHQSPIPFVEARQVYRDLGFKPHAGYPLRKEVQS
jgi:hypothetical protein